MMCGFSKEFVDYYCLNEEAKNSLPSRSMKESDMSKQRHERRI